MKYCVLIRFSPMAFKMLSKMQRLKLAETTIEWTDMPFDWKAGIVFLRLEEKDLVSMRFRRTDHCDVSCGPGAVVTGFWQTKRTEKGNNALHPTGSSHG
jgi:hypothetical protein